jgi:hypothetical protein
MSTALLNNRKQAIRDRIYNINATESFMLLVSKGSLKVLLSNTTSFTLSATVISFTLLVSNSYNKDPLKAENKIKAAKIDSIKLKAKQLKQKRQTTS